MNNLSIAFRELRDVRFRGDISRGELCMPNCDITGAKIKNSKRNAKRLNEFHGEGA